MKKIMIFLLFTVVLLCNKISAQKVEINVSYGITSLFGEVESLTMTLVDDVFRTIDERPLITYQSEGVFSVDITLSSKSKKWQFGLLYSYEGLSDEDNSIKGQFHSVLLQTKYSWFNPHHKFIIYSGIGLGVLYGQLNYYDSRENGFLPGFNLTPIGISYGGKMGVFVEANIGAKGIIQGGLSYTF